MNHELDPQIFPNVAAVQAFCAEGIRNYRTLQAERLRMLAADYELQLLTCADTSERAWLEGISEGLKTAAAELDTEKVTA